MSRPTFRPIPPCAGPTAILAWLALVISGGCSLWVPADPRCDVDGDEYAARECESGNDCDDGDPAVHPGILEIPYDGIDQDCDGTDLVDVDGDGFASREVEGPAASDCDDSDPDAYPGAHEVCYDGIDQDCDDWDLKDCDRDGQLPVGLGGTDCDDADPKVYKGAADPCDSEGVDQDCGGADGTVEIPYDGADQDCDGVDLNDVDGDGYPSAAVGGRDCNDNNEDISPGAEDIACDGVDQDCNGEDADDRDGDGYSGCGETPVDCDDNDPAINPLILEVACDDTDQDCDGADSRDGDGDGSPCDVDCDDTNAAIRPDAPEVPYDGIDQDCSGEDLTDVDGDGSDSVAVGGEDCDDHDPNVGPGTGNTVTTDPYGAMVPVPPGLFVMGSSDESADTDAGPAHQVWLSGYCIEAFEVSNARYAPCVEAGVCDAPPPWSSIRDEYYGNPEYDNYPVLVNWYNARTFCEWTGRTLPTEAQWEKAARGGCEDHEDVTECDTADYDVLFPWGNDTPSCDLANYDDCFADTEAVDFSRQGATPRGTYNMAGNVGEMTADWYQASYYSTFFDADQQIQVPTDPIGPAQGEKRAVRGGTFLSGAGDITVYARDWTTMDQVGYDTGFRCVKIPTQDLQINSFRPRN